MILTTERSKKNRLKEKPHTNKNALSENVCMLDVCA